MPHNATRHFFSPIAAVTLLVLLLCAHASAPPAMASATVAPDPVAAASVILEAPAPLASRGEGPPPLSPSGNCRTEFLSWSPDTLSVGSPRLFLQRGEYRENALFVSSEIGDLTLSETSHTATGVSRRGGRLGLGVGAAGNALKVESFATSGEEVGGRLPLLAGATAELSLAQRARVKAIYLQGNQPLLPSRKGRDAGERRGETIGFVAVLQPFATDLAAEAEMDISRSDLDTADDAAAVSDTAYRLNIQGTFGGLHHRAWYEYTGPRYRVVAGEGPRKGSEKIGYTLQAALPSHTVAVDLSRFDGSAGRRDLPQIYKYEGGLDYGFRGIAALPLGLQYRKTLLLPGNGAAAASKQTDSDAFSATANYLFDRWDLGLRASYLQRSDRSGDGRELTTAAVAVSPRYAVGERSVAPEFLLRRSNNYSDSSLTESYGFKLQIRDGNGSGLPRYELKSELLKEQVSNGREVVSGRMKFACQLKKAVKNALFPSVAFKGEYSQSKMQAAAPPQNDYALLLLLESRAD